MPRVRPAPILIPALLGITTLAVTQGPVDSPPTYTLIITRAANNTSGFSATGGGDTFNYGASAGAQTPYSNTSFQSGGATATWTIKKQSSVNPGALTVNLKCKTRSFTNVSFIIDPSTGGPPATPPSYTWDLRAHIQGLYEDSSTVNLAGTHTSFSGTSGNSTDDSGGYVVKPDFIIQLSSDSWTRVGSTNEWRAEVKHPCLVFAEAQTAISGPAPFRAFATAYGNTEVKLTFPAYPGGTTTGGGSTGTATTGTSTTGTVTTGGSTGTTTGTTGGPIGN